MSLEDISSQVVPVVEKITGEAGTQTQKVAGSNEVIIKTRTLNMDEREELNQALADQLVWIKRRSQPIVSPVQSARR